VTVKIEDN